MKVLIAGATGFIGRNLIDALIENDYTVSLVSRNPARASQQFPKTVRVIGWESSELMREVAESKVVINLAGESIAGSPWTRKKKTAIVNSRLHSAQRLADALKLADDESIVYLQASAIGYYGNRHDEQCVEGDPAGDGFLAEVCKKWESYIPAIEKTQKRVLTLRIGVALGTQGGFLQEIVKQSRRRLAGTLGDGKQWISWIHIYDLVYAILYLMNDNSSNGIYNIVAPEAVRQGDLFKNISSMKKRRFQFTAPPSLVKTIFGEMGKELMLSGQKVVPAKLNKQGFVYKYANIDAALENLLF